MFKLLHLSQPFKLNPVTQHDVHKMCVRMYGMSYARVDHFKHHAYHFLYLAQILSIEKEILSAYRKHMYEHETKTIAMQNERVVPTHKSSLRVCLYSNNSNRTNAAGEF